MAAPVTWKIPWNITWKITRGCIFGKRLNHISMWKTIKSNIFRRPWISQKRTLVMRVEIYHILSFLTSKRVFVFFPKIQLRYKWLHFPLFMLNILLKESVTCKLVSMVIFKPCCWNILQIFFLFILIATPNIFWK